MHYERHCMPVQGSLFGPNIIRMENYQVPKPRKRKYTPDQYNQTSRGYSTQATNLRYFQCRMTLLSLFSCVSHKKMFKQKFLINNVVHAIIIRLLSKLTIF